MAGQEPSGAREAQGEAARRWKLKVKTTKMCRTALYHVGMRFLAGFLIALGVVMLGLALAGDFQVDLQVHLGKSSLGKPSPRPGGVKTLVLQASDNGKTVHVRVGQEVVVNLGAGYGVPYSSNAAVLAPLLSEGGQGVVVPQAQGNFYCGQLPVPTPVSGVSSDCAMPCYVLPTPIPPLRTLPITIPASGAISASPPASSNPSTGAISPNCQPYCPTIPPGVVIPMTPGMGSGSTAPGGALSPYCAPYCCQTTCPLPASGGTGSSTLCNPYCGCGTYCANPATGGMATGGDSGTTPNGTASIYCQPCPCGAFCVAPMQGGAPATGNGSGGNVGSALAPNLACGQGHWRAKEVGKADIIVSPEPICLACMGASPRLAAEFVVHVVVQP